MAEYWKSTPKYLCKDCNLYVRDTNLERANHEATARHKAARQRTLREIHNRHEREEREKERARREVERVSGVVSGKSPASVSTTTPVAHGGVGGADVTAAELTEEQRRAQLEQLASMGISIPDQLRGGIAMAGEWTVTRTRVISAGGEQKEKKKDVEFRGVRIKKTEVSEEERETEKALKGLAGSGGDFSGVANNKKRKRFVRAGGRDPFSEMEELGELDVLLAGGFAGKGAKKEEPEDKKRLVHNEEDQTKDDELDKIKTEPESDGEKKVEHGDGSIDVKKEGRNMGESLAANVHADVPAMPVFKKRKPKNLRQK